MPLEASKRGGFEPPLLTVVLKRKLDKKKIGEGKIMWVGKVVQKNSDVIKMRD